MDPETDTVKGQQFFEITYLFGHIKVCIVLFTMKTTIGQPWILHRKLGVGIKFQNLI